MFKNFSSQYAFLFTILIFSLTGCFSQSINTKISNSLGIKILANLKIEYEDTHGGFHGDGVTLAKVELESKDAEKILSEIKANDNWESLPLSENIKTRMYGGENYSSDLAERLDMPEIQNGYWTFIDRFNGENKINDDKLLFTRGAANFTIGIYDAENNILYYCKYDS